MDVGAAEEVCAVGKVRPVQPLSSLTICFSFTVEDCAGFVRPHDEEDPTMTLHLPLVYQCPTKDGPRVCACVEQLSDCALYVCVRVSA